MKNPFIGFYRPSEDELSELWKSCIFVLDANVLLNLYRYSKETREDLLNILKQVSDRFWVPYQAALEFQENRLNVIAEQVKRYDEVEDVLKESQTGLTSDLNKLQLKKRHSMINPDKLLKQVDSIFKRYKRELATLKREQPDVFDEDRLRDEIDSLLDGKVGPPPESQDELEKIYKEGEIRYKENRPPGYMDEEKTHRDEKETYVYGGLSFKRKYGDLILWYQIIKEAKGQDEFKKIIFVTDDDKEDWWWIVSGKTIGPRPELIEEISSEAGVSLFYMYNSERFMQFAQKYLGVQIKKESIEQVRDSVNFYKSVMKLRRTVIDRRRAEIARRTEYQTIQKSIHAMMVDNGISSITAAFDFAGGTGTNDMSGFPDTTATLATKGANAAFVTAAIAAGDITAEVLGYRLYGNQIVVDVDGDGTYDAADDVIKAVNYVGMRTSAYYYTCESDGTIRQFADPSLVTEYTY